MSEKRLDLTLRLFMMQYGTRVVDMEWVIKLHNRVFQKTVK